MSSIEQSLQSLAGEIMIVSTAASTAASASFLEEAKLLLYLLLIPLHDSCAQFGARPITKLAD